MSWNISLNKGSTWTTFCLGGVVNRLSKISALNYTLSRSFSLKNGTAVHRTCFIWWKAKIYDDHQSAVIRWLWVLRPWQNRQSEKDMFRGLQWYHGDIQSGLGSSESSAVQLGTSSRIQRTGTVGLKEWLARGPTGVQRWNRRKS